MVPLLFFPSPSFSPSFSQTCTEGLVELSPLILTCFPCRAQCSKNIDPPMLNLSACTIKCVSLYFHYDPTQISV